MDVAKLSAAIAAPGNSQELSEMWGVEQVRGGRLPLLQVPTTAGTGSEVTPIAIVTTGTAEKRGVVSRTLLPDATLLDGETLTSLPQPIAAATAIDAMVHAIEAYTSARAKNPLSDVLARAALSALGANVRAVCAPAACGARSAALSAARSQMLLGACYAGMAFANAPVGGVHALAYPLGARHGVPHGLSNSLVLPHVLRFNAADVAAAQLYAELHAVLAPVLTPELAPLDEPRAEWRRRASAGAASAGGGPGGTRAHTSALALAEELAAGLAALSEELGLPGRLADVGVSAADIAELTDDAMKQTRLLPNNPRTLTRIDAEAIYHAAL